MSIWNEIKASYREGNILTKLIYVNVGLFVVIKLLQLMLLLFGAGSTFANVVVSWLSVPSNPLSLLLRPWTLLTYMFLHYDFFHLLFNVLYLYWFGRLFVDLIDGGKLLTIYILGGIGGALVFLLAFNFLPAFYPGGGGSILLGASASVMAILFAVARVNPNFVVYVFLIGPVKLKYLALVAFLIDLVSIPGMANAGGHLAHIGGALVGLYYGWKLSEGKIKGNYFDRLASQVGGLFRKRSHMQVTYRRPLSDMEYNAQKIRRQKELDRILEKIKNSGYDSLSKEEKETLFKASKEN
ncbi:rhomboid family protein [Thermophagus xiamenensis]|uniref:Membrane associated serine protease, rhomboid family n=1 Tax=Thermophagus xiamenensis TaxID=385682 RepID=A0A1I2CKN1_9BACT|nr:rhomboid family intramembrane serine protease [Thermophagus xiamenensis]SFE68861.1 Membrane associated serine protease, rhomboid family [Thermophagus xiamenensis]